MAARKKTSRASMAKARKKNAGKKRPVAKKKSPSMSKAAMAMKRPASARASSPRAGKSPMQRISSVAAQVVQQAQSAVSEGVEVLREVGESLAERVAG